MNKLVMYQSCQNCQKCINHCFCERVCERGRELVRNKRYCARCFDYEKQLKAVSYESKINKFCCDKCCCNGQRVVKRISRKRDRAPSRICLKRIHSLFHKKSVVKRGIKNHIKRNVPDSSRLKAFVRASVRIDMLNRAQHVSFLYLKLRFKKVILSSFYCGLLHSISGSGQKSKNYRSFIFSSFCNDVYGFWKFSYDKKFSILYKMLFMCGDIEKNPGPVVNFDENMRVNNRECYDCSSLSLLRNRLRAVGLVPFDCGGNGDCFFRSVSHQIFGSVANHLRVRFAGVEYLRNHCEEFVEFLEGQSWLDYLSSMCREGTWCDALIVQAVANAFNLRINIVESGDGFSELTVVECQHSGFETRRSIVLGHVDEYHYVSTISLDFCGSNVSDNECERVTFVDEQNADIMVSIGNNRISQYVQTAAENNSSSNDELSYIEKRKLNNRIYMREYRKRKLNALGLSNQCKINSRNSSEGQMKNGIHIKEKWKKKKNE